MGVAPERVSGDSDEARAALHPSRADTAIRHTNGHVAHRSLQAPTVSVVIPTLNEAKNLPHVLPLIPDWVHEVVIVDGRSTDRTIEVAQELRPDVVVVREMSHGKGAALIAGFHASTGEIIITLDADGSADPREFPAFVGALMAGADFAKGTRFAQGGGTTDMEVHRRLGNWWLRMVAKLLFGGRFSDLCYGYNAFWRSALAHIQPDADGFEIESVLSLRALRADLRIVEVPSFEAERIHGTSNLRAVRDGIRVLRAILRERFSRQTAAVIDLRSLERGESGERG
jgi:glycosyltransferase involved in cell wall biosynthesis